MVRQISRITSAKQSINKKILITINNYAIFNVIAIVILKTALFATKVHVHVTTINCPLDLL